MDTTWFEEAEAFVAKADLSDYDLSGAKLVRFELKRKDKSINLRLPEKLLNAVRDWRDCTAYGRVAL